MEKEQEYALFVDNSGSVWSRNHYWSTVETIMDQYAKDISHYYLWNSTCEISSKKEVYNNILMMHGTGGTRPNNVASEIVDNKF